MENVLSEFLKMMFQPPALILFCAAVVGLSLMLSDRSEYRLRVNMEWQARESFYREIGFNADLLERARQKFYRGKFVKAPRRNS